MTHNIELRVVGLLILAAFPLYGGGQALLGGSSHSIGMALCLANSMGVITIGLLLRRVIAQTDPQTARIYFVARLIEGVLLGLGLFAVQGSLFGLTMSGDNMFHLAMISLGLGSLPMCKWLIRSNTVPAIIGWLGFLGYIFLIAGMVVASRGFEDLSMYLMLPGTLFEFIFGVMLVIGRASPRSVAST